MTEKLLNNKIKTILVDTALEMIVKAINLDCFLLAKDRLKNLKQLLEILEE